MTAALGFGAILAIGNTASPVVYTTVGELKNVVPGDITREAVDSSHHATPDQFREYLPGWMDGGEYSAEIHYLPATTDTVLTALMASTLAKFQLTWPNGIREQVSCVITSYGRTTPMEDVMVKRIVFKVSGKPTMLAAA